MERVITKDHEISPSFTTPDPSDQGFDPKRLDEWPELGGVNLQKKSVSSWKAPRPLVQEQSVECTPGPLPQTDDLPDFSEDRATVPACDSQGCSLQNKNNVIQETQSRANAQGQALFKPESRPAHNHYHYDATSTSRWATVTPIQYHNIFREWSIQCNSTGRVPQASYDAIRKPPVIFEAHSAEDEHPTCTIQSNKILRQVQAQLCTQPQRSRNEIPNEKVGLHRPDSPRSVDAGTGNYDMCQQPPDMAGRVVELDPSNRKSNETDINIFSNAPQDTGALTLHQTITKRKRTSEYDRGLCHFFLQCAPTDERLEELGKHWLDVQFVQKRITHTRPFKIMVHDTSKGYVVKSNDELSYDLKKDSHWNSFALQMSRDWPKSFGKLVSQGGQAPHFLFDVPSLNHDTIFACRKVCELGGMPSRLEILFNGAQVHLDRDDGMLWQVTPDIATTSLTISTVALLECLFAPIHKGYTGFGISGFGTLVNWFPIQNTTPVLYRSGDLGLGDWLCIRINLRTCIPDYNGSRARRFKDGSGVSPRGLGFPLERQTARLPGISNDKDQSAVEYLLSVAIVMRKTVQNDMPSLLKYNVVAWLDYHTNLNAPSERSKRAPFLSNAVDRDLNLRDCGSGGFGFVQFLIVLSRAMDHWTKCWNVMLDKIDETVGVQLKDTLDKERWEMLMFDNSFQLSEQYFTVLQLLRIYQDWIMEAEEGINNLGEELINQCRSWHAWQQQASPVDEVEWPLLMDNLKSNFNNVNEFFRQRVNSLKERIQRKKDEVQSLRDGLFNAASLRENLKANTMNLYIGVFTIVTVFFTPLSFIATFWAIPYTSTDARSSTPKEFLTSFITVPLLTYIASGGIIAYVWTCASPSLETSIPVKLRRVSGITWESLGKLFSTSLGKFRKRSKNVPLDKEANSAKANSSDQRSSQS